MRKSGLDGTNKGLFRYGYAFATQAFVGNTKISKLLRNFATQ